MLTINASVPPRKEPPSRGKRDIGAIVGGIVGGVAAIFTVIGVVIFVQRRRRWARPKSLLSSYDSREAGSQVLVTPFDLTLNTSEGNQDTGIPPEHQLLVGENTGADMASLHRLSSSPPAVLPLPQPVVPVPVGLSDKEIARLRARTFSSSQAQTRSTSNSVTESGETSSSYNTWRLHSEVESLRREMERLRELERLRAEGSVVEAPPSYTEGGR